MLARFLSVLAVMGLAQGAAAGPAAGGGEGSFLLIPICGDVTHFIKIPKGGNAPKQPDCSGGCHALCTRRQFAGTEDGDDDAPMA